MSRLYYHIELLNPGLNVPGMDLTLSDIKKIAKSIGAIIEITPPRRYTGMRTSCNRPGVVYIKNSKLQILLMARTKQ